jgi:RNA polymerase sigma-70 factor (ECF subfamily)
MRVGDDPLAPLNEADLAALIRRETPRLFAVIRCFTEHDDDAEDLLQHLWLIVLDRSHRRDARMPMGAWLHTVALNLGRSHHRRAKRRKWLRLRWAADLPRTSSEGNTVTVADAAGTAVAELPRLQREVLLLRVVEELSTRETALRLGRAEGTVKASLHRALSTLRMYLSPGQR